MLCLKLLSASKEKSWQFADRCCVFICCKIVKTVVNSQESDTSVWPLADADTDLHLTMILCFNLLITGSHFKPANHTLLIVTPLVHVGGWLMAYFYSTIQDVDFRVH